MQSEGTPREQITRRTRRSLLGLAAGAVVGVGGWEWLTNGDPDEDDIPQRLRKALNFNERVVRKTLYSNRNLAPTFPASAITAQKVNGDDGMDGEAGPDWCLEVVPLDAGKPAHKLSIAEVKALPRREEIIEFKCVEGWSAITQFAGARLSDFTDQYAHGSDKAKFVGMVTPDEEYYVGLDMPSAMQEQTLLAYEMNGKPLENGHGAPLRLVIPVKYGIKNIKRIGRISYTDTQPPDFWAERGYDYYSGL